MYRYFVTDYRFYRQGWSTARKNITIEAISHSIEAVDPVSFRSTVYPGITEGIFENGQTWVIISFILFAVRVSKRGVLRYSLLDLRFVQIFDHFFSIIALSKFLVYLHKMTFKSCHWETQRITGIFWHVSLFIESKVHSREKTFVFATKHNVRKTKHG